jgi:hypothetical protein
MNVYVYPERSEGSGGNGAGQDTARAKLVLVTARSFAVCAAYVYPERSEGSGGRKNPFGGSRHPIHLRSAARSFAVCAAQDKVS